MVDETTPAPPVPAKKAEDTATGCQAHSEHDLDLAKAEANPQMRERLESSAAVWAARSTLLKRLEAGRTRADTK